MIVLIGLLFLNSLSDASARNAQPGEVWGAVAHLVLLVVMLVCMFFHEVGHALMARLRRAPAHHDSAFVRRPYFF
ncbi:MAG: hypothetical protein IPP14_13925 [Planctomycetes bacterium]|nr:hypothetical protein [Planctomycetota bacterium]